MKISDSNQLNNAAGLGRTRQAEALAGYGAPGAAGRLQTPGDYADISGLAGKLSSVLGADSPERAARLEKLAQLYAAGGYQPQSAGASRGMVAEALAASPEAGA
jgi:hypothetical protein